MKNKYSFFLIMVIFISLVQLACSRNAKDSKELVVQSLDDKGIFVGEKSKAVIRQEEHNEALRSVDKAWDNITIGDVRSKVNDYKGAVIAYKKAYDIGGNSKALSGLLLAETYEKLGRYDEGIALLDQMIQNRELSANGVKNANEIKSRLLAAKQNQPQISNT